MHNCTHRKAYLVQFKSITINDTLLFLSIIGFNSDIFTPLSQGVHAFHPTITFGYVFSLTANLSSATNIADTQFRD